MYRIKISHLRCSGIDEINYVPAWWNSTDRVITLTKGDSTLYKTKADAKNDLKWFNTYLRNDAQKTKIVKEA